jgi:hypothetical protein
MRVEQGLNVPLDPQQKANRVVARARKPVTMNGAEEAFCISLQRPGSVSASGLGVMLKVSECVPSQGILVKEWFQQG